MAINLVHQTAGQFADRFFARLQAAFENGNKVEFCRLIWWIYNRIQAGDLTSSQVRTAYNNYFNKSLTSTQWNALVAARFAPARDRYQAMLDEAQI